MDLLNEERAIAFEDNPHHRRAKLIRMTEAGQRKYAQISRIQARWVNELSRGLTVKELRNAVALLRDIDGRLRQRPDAAVAP